MYAYLLHSGSMKDHLALLKDTLKFVIKQLRSDDKLFLATFDHEVGLPLKPRLAVIVIWNIGRLTSSCP